MRDARAGTAAEGHSPETLLQAEVHYAQVGQGSFEAVVGDESRAADVDPAMDHRAEPAEQPQNEVGDGDGWLGAADFAQSVGLGGVFDEASAGEAEADGQRPAKRQRRDDSDDGRFGEQRLGEHEVDLLAAEFGLSPGRYAQDETFGERSGTAEEEWANGWGWLGLSPSGTEDGAVDQEPAASPPRDGALAERQLPADWFDSGLFPSEPDAASDEDGLARPVVAAPAADGTRFVDAEVGFGDGAVPNPAELLAGPASEAEPAGPDPDAMTVRDMLDFLHVRLGSWPAVVAEVDASETSLYKWRSKPPSGESLAKIRAAVVRHRDAEPYAVGGPAEQERLRECLASLREDLGLVSDRDAAWALGAHPHRVGSWRKGAAIGAEYARRIDELHALVREAKQRGGFDPAALLEEWRARPENRAPVGGNGRVRSGEALPYRALLKLVQHALGGGYVAVARKLTAGGERVDASLVRGWTRGEVRAGGTPDQDQISRIRAVADEVIGSDKLEAYQKTLTRLKALTRAPRSNMQAAKKLGVARATVSSWLRGDRLVDEEHAARIDAEFGRLPVEARGEAPAGADWAEVESGWDSGAEREGSLAERSAVDVAALAAGAFDGLRGSAFSGGHAEPYAVGRPAEQERLRECLASLREDLGLVSDRDAAWALGASRTRVGHWRKGAAIGAEYARRIDELHALVREAKQRGGFDPAALLEEWRARPENRAPVGGRGRVRSGPDDAAAGRAGEALPYRALLKLVQHALGGGYVAVARKLTAGGERVDASLVRGWTRGEVRAGGTPDQDQISRIRAVADEVIGSDKLEAYQKTLTRLKALTRAPRSNMQAAKKLGVARATVSSWLRGDRLVDEEHAARIDAEFGRLPVEARGEAPAGADWAEWPGDVEDLLDDLSVNGDDFGDSAEQLTGNELVFSDNELDFFGDAQPADGAQRGEEGERAVRSGPEGAGDMEIDVAPAVDYTMVHGGDSGLPASSENEQADEAGGELLASGEVSTDRWIPFGTGEGTPEAFTFTPVPPGTSTVTRTADGEPATSDTRWQISRPQGSGERTRVGYSWAHYRGATPAQDTIRLTRRIHLATHDASPEQVTVLQNGLRTALNDLVNQRDYRLPALQPDQVTGPALPGPLLRVDVRFVDSPADADSVVTVHDGLPGPGHPMVQNIWYTDVHPAAYVHEIVHGLGVIDDNPDPRVLLTPGGRGEQVLAEGESSLMGPFTDPARQDFVLTTDHLRQIADVLSPYLHTTTTPAEHTEPAVAHATASQLMSPPPGQTGPDTAPAVDDQTAQIALSQLNDLVRTLGSGAAVARELEYAPATVNKWLSGTRPVSADAAGRIAGLHGRLASGDVRSPVTAASFWDILESLYVKEREKHADDESALRAVADALSGGTVEVDRDDVYDWMSGKRVVDPAMHERIAEYAALVHPDGLPTAPADTPALHTVQIQYLVDRLGSETTAELLDVPPQVLESLHASTSSPTPELAERITATLDLLLTQNTTPNVDDVTNHVRQSRTPLQNAIADLTRHLGTQAAVARVLDCDTRQSRNYRWGGHESRVSKKTADRIRAALALLDEGRPVTAEAVTERVTQDATTTKLKALRKVAGSERDLARELKAHQKTLRRQLKGAQASREFAERVDALFEQCEQLGIDVLGTATAGADGNAPTTLVQARMRLLLNRQDPQLDEAGQVRAAAVVLAETDQDRVRAYLTGTATPPPGTVGLRLKAAADLLLKRPVGPVTAEEVDARVSDRRSWQTKIQTLWDALRSDENVATVLRITGEAVLLLRLGEVTNPLRETADRIDVALHLLDEHGPRGVTADAVARGVTPYDARPKVRLLVQWYGTLEAARKLQADEPTVRLLRIFRETEKLTVDTARRIDTTYDSLVSRLRDLGIDPAEAPVQLTGNELTVAGVEERSGRRGPDVAPAMRDARGAGEQGEGVAARTAGELDLDELDLDELFDFGDSAEQFAQLPGNELDFFGDAQPADGAQLGEEEERAVRPGPPHLPSPGDETGGEQRLITEDDAEERVQPRTIRPATSRAAEYPEGQPPAKQRRLNDESGADESHLGEWSDWAGDVEDLLEDVEDLLDDLSVNGDDFDDVLGSDEFLGRPQESSGTNGEPAGPVAPQAPAAGVSTVAGTAAAQPADGAQPGEEGERAVRSGPEGAGDMAIDVAPAVDYTMVHGDDFSPGERVEDDVDFLMGDFLGPWFEQPGAGDLLGESDGIGPGDTVAADGAESSENLFAEDEALFHREQWLQTSSHESVSTTGEERVQPGTTRPATNRAAESPEGQPPAKKRRLNDESGADEWDLGEWSDWARAFEGLLDGPGSVSEPDAPVPGTEPEVPFPGAVETGRAQIRPDLSGRWVGEPFGGQLRLRNFEARRYQLPSGEFATQAVIRLSLLPVQHERPITDEELGELRQRAQQGVDILWNTGHRLPNGDVFQLGLWFVPDGEIAHHIVQVHREYKGTTSNDWGLEERPYVLAHELGHLLGLEDEYRAADRNRWRAVYEDEGLMGPFLVDDRGRAQVDNDHRNDQGWGYGRMRIRPRYLRQLGGWIEAALETARLRTDGQVVFSTADRLQPRADGLPTRPHFALDVRTSVLYGEARTGGGGLATPPPASDRPRPVAVKGTEHPNGTYRATYPGMHERMARNSGTLSVAGDLVLPSKPHRGLMMFPAQWTEEDAVYAAEQAYLHALREGTVLPVPNRPGVYTWTGEYDGVRIEGTLSRGVFTDFRPSDDQPGTPVPPDDVPPVPSAPTPAVIGRRVENLVRFGDRRTRTGAHHEPGLSPDAQMYFHGLMVNRGRQHHNFTYDAQVLFLHPRLPVAQWLGHGQEPKSWYSDFDWAEHVDGEPHVMFPLAWQPDQLLASAAHAHKFAVAANLVRPADAPDMKPGTKHWVGMAGDIRIEGLERDGRILNFRPTHVQPHTSWPRSEPVGEVNAGPVTVDRGGRVLPLDVRHVLFANGQRAIDLAIRVHLDPAPGTDVARMDKNFDSLRAELAVSLISAGDRMRTDGVLVRVSLVRADSAENAHHSLSVNADQLGAMVEKIAGFAGLVPGLVQQRELAERLLNGPVPRPDEWRPATDAGQEVGSHTLSEAAGRLALADPFSGPTTLREPDPSDRGDWGGWGDWLHRPAPSAPPLDLLDDEVPAAGGSRAAAGPVAPQAPAAGVSTVAGTAAGGHSPATLLQAEARYALRGLDGSFEAVADRVGAKDARSVEGWESGRISHLNVEHAERLRALVDLLQARGGTGPVTKEEVDAQVSDNWSSLQSKIVRLVKGLGSVKDVAKVLFPKTGTRPAEHTVRAYRSGDVTKPAKAVVDRIDAALALLEERGPGSTVTAEEVDARVTPYDPSPQLKDLEKWLGSKSAVARELRRRWQDIASADFADALHAAHSKYRELGLDEGETVFPLYVGWLVAYQESVEAVAVILKDDPESVQAYWDGALPGPEAAERIMAAVALLRKPDRTGPITAEDVDAQVRHDWSPLQSKTALLLERQKSREAVADILNCTVKEVDRYRFGHVMNAEADVADRYDAALALLKERSGTVSRDEVTERARVRPYQTRGKLGFLARFWVTPMAVARSLTARHQNVRTWMSGEVSPSMLDRDRIDTAYKSLRTRLRALDVDFGDSAGQPVQHTGNELVFSDNELDFFGDAQPTDGAQLGEEEERAVWSGPPHLPNPGDETGGEQRLITEDDAEERVQPGTIRPATSRAAESPEGQPPAKQRRLNDESGADESHLNARFDRAGDVEDLLKDVEDLFVHGDDFDDVLGSDEFPGRPQESSGTNGEPAGPVAPQAPAAGVSTVAGTAAAQPADGAQLGEEGERAVRSGPEGAGDMAIDVAPAVDYTMVHGDDFSPGERVEDDVDFLMGDFLGPWFEQPGAGDLLGESDGIGPGDTVAADGAESSENLFAEDEALFLSEQWLQTSSHESVSTTGEEHVQLGTTRPATNRAAESPEGQPPAKQRRLNDESGADESHLNARFDRAGDVEDRLEDVEDLFVHGDDFDDVLGSDEFPGRPQESSGTNGEPAGPVAPQAPAAGISTVAGTAAEGRNPETLFQAEVRYARERLGSFEAVTDIVGRGDIETKTERLRALVDLLLERDGTGPLTEEEKEKVDARVHSNRSSLQNTIVRLKEGLGSFEAVAAVLRPSKTIRTSVSTVRAYRSGDVTNPAKVVVDRAAAALDLLDDPEHTGPVTAEEVDARVTPYDARGKLKDLERWLGSKTAVAPELRKSTDTVRNARKGNDPRADFADALDAAHSKYRELEIPDGKTVFPLYVGWLVAYQESVEAVAVILRDERRFVQAYWDGVLPGPEAAERIMAAVALLRKPDRTGPITAEDVDAQVRDDWSPLQSKTALLLERQKSREAVAAILKRTVVEVDRYRFGHVMNPQADLADRYDAALALLKERGPSGTVDADEVAERARVRPYQTRGKLGFLAKFWVTPMAVARSLTARHQNVRTWMSGEFSPSMLDRDRIDAECKSLRKRLRALGVDLGDSAGQPVRLIGNEPAALFPPPATASPTTPDAPTPTTPAAHQETPDTPAPPFTRDETDIPTRQFMEDYLKEVTATLTEDVSMEEDAPTWEEARRASDPEPEDQDGAGPTGLLAGDFDFLGTLLGATDRLALGDPFSGPTTLREPDPSDRGDWLHRAAPSDPPPDLLDDEVPAAGGSRAASPAVPPTRSGRTEAVPAESSFHEPEAAGGRRSPGVGRALSAPFSSSDEAGAAQEREPAAVQQPRPAAEPPVAAGESGAAADANLGDVPRRSPAEHASAGRDRRAELDQLLHLQAVLDTPVLSRHVEGVAYSQSAAATWALADTELPLRDLALSLADRVKLLHRHPELFPAEVRESFMRLTAHEPG
ncbi:EndoU domain-containing protein [Streptomyces sp. NPDC050121]|uniref:EndoU domain-containing protein n=1 Tax=Streptomyces sp. NPDC050121 TaxID=3365601 RepID=UPI0037AF4703